MDIRRDLHEAPDEEDFPVPILLARVMSRLDEPTHPTTRRWQALVGAILAVALVASFLVIRANREALTPSPANSVASPSPASAADLQRGRWSTLPPAPIEPRDGASIVWTGRDLLVWGGYRYPSGAAVGDGAAYDPETRRWRKLPSSPLSSRSGQVTVWTGSEMVVWGGTDAKPLDDGAAYNPITNTWRALSQGPLSARGAAIGIWTGKELVVLGGLYGSGQHYVDGAAIDPHSGSWRAIAAPIPPSGHPLAWKAAAYVDGQVLAWSEWSTSRRIGPGAYSLSGGVDLFSYAVDTDMWRLVPTSPAALPDVEQVLVANQLVIVRGEPIHCGFSCPILVDATAIYDPVSMAWSRLPADPLGVEHPSSAWTGAALFSYANATVDNYHPFNVSAYDVGANRWIGLPTVPFGCVSYPVTWVWTGRAVLLYCSRPLPAASAISGLALESP
jgi:hypothetical protein